MASLDKNARDDVTTTDLLTGTLPKVDPIEGQRFEKLIGGGCGGGACPTIYQQPGDLDNYYVQGYNLSSQQLQSLIVPDGEGLVRIPKTLIHQLLQRDNL
jgi:hypothetical protein